jgi:hypothetical protein
VQQLTDQTTFRKQREHIRNYDQRKTLSTKKVDEECWKEFAKIFNNRKLRVKQEDQTAENHRNNSTTSSLHLQTKAFPKPPTLKKVDQLLKRPTMTSSNSPQCKKGKFRQHRLQSYI